MIPISDDNPTRLTPFVTWAFFGACIGAFLWQLSYSEAAENILVKNFAFTPASFFAPAVDDSIFSPSRPWLTLVTSMFLHGGFLHLGGNMLYLWIFGNNVEDAFGHVRFFLFYLTCGVAAALAEGLVQPQSAVPMLGASGAISGVLAGYVLIFPRAPVKVIVPLGFFLYPARISAFYVIGFWFLLQLLSGFTLAPEASSTAWWAHIGGFGAGIVMTPLFSRFPLFGRQSRGPWS